MPETCGICRRPMHGHFAVSFGAFEQKIVTCVDAPRDVLVFTDQRPDCGCCHCSDRAFPSPSPVLMQRRLRL
jgi:hypothetical protein